MFRYSKIILSAFCLCALFGCSEENRITPHASESSSESIRISTSIVSGGVSTAMRVTSQNNGSGMFDENDQITCFTDSKSYPWKSHLLSFEKGLWTPNIYWNTVGERGEKVDFHAYYPAFKNSVGKETSFYVSEDQTTISNLTASDLLGAICSTEISKEVSLDFKHLMSHIEVALESNDNSFTQDQIKEAKVEIRAYLGGEILLAQNQVGNPDKSNVKWIKTYTSNEVHSAIVFPQVLSDFRGEDAWIKIVIDGKTIQYKAPKSLDGNNLEALQGGHNLKIKLNLQRKQKEAEPIEVSEDVRNRTLWVYGLNMPQNHDWKNGLLWKAEYGWFDCNKSYPQRGGADANFCWAAAAADMIHWFLKNNEANIKRYEEITKKKFRGPSTYTDHIHSDVFDWFKKKHPNTGGETGNAINHYMLGAYISPGEPYQGNVNTTDAGFLYEITGGVNLVTTQRYSGRGGIDKSTFNRVMKTALLNKKSIGFSRPLHVMAIWGADFDAEGNVSAIYIVDNNDTAYGGKMWRKRIAFKNNETYLESSVEGHFTYPIVKLTFLELGEKLWKEYFDKHKAS